MRPWLRLIFLALCAGAVAAPVQGIAGAKSADRPALDDLLNRAAWYLDYFIDQFENVVAEESYVQDASTPLPSYAPIGGRGGSILPGPSAAELGRARHRDLRSDFLLVKSHDTLALVAFRDVITVDGVSVRDRQQRLAKLFLDAPADTMTQAQRIGDEGARYNLGNMRSTLGNPVLGLGVLQFSYQSRFKFSLGKEDRGVGPGVWIVEYQETASPAMIRGEANRDLFAHGRVWIDSINGSVLKTELLVEQPTVRAQIVTTFRVDERFTIAVPSEMREQYSFNSGSKIATVASYGRFRRFDVTAEENVRVPMRLLTDGVSGTSFLELPPGRFTMGSAPSEVGRNGDEMLHDVTISKPFYIGQFEVTQQDWRAVMGTSPSTFKDCGARCPVESVTFEEVQQFIEKLNARRPASGPSLRYRLPTEAEWRAACRAGTTGPFSTGENITTAQGNYNGNFYNAAATGTTSRSRCRSAAFS